MDRASDPVATPLYRPAHTCDQASSVWTYYVVSAPSLSEVLNDHFLIPSTDFGLSSLSLFCTEHVRLIFAFISGDGGTGRRRAEREARGSSRERLGSAADASPLTLTASDLG